MPHSKAGLAMQKQQQQQYKKRSWSGSSSNGPSHKRSRRGLVGALESISLHDDDESRDQHEDAMEDDDDELEVSSHSLISRMEGFDDDDEDTDDDNDDDYDQELLSDEEMLKRRLEQQVFHKLALGTDERDPTERRIAQIILHYMEHASSSSKLPMDERAVVMEGPFCSLAMDLD